MRQIASVALIGALLAQTGCNQAGNDAATAERSRANPTASAPPSTIATAGTPANDGVVVELAPLTQADIAAADLPQELGCSFSSPAGALLVGYGVVGGDEPARAVVKIAGKLEPLVSRNAGYEGMSVEGAFTGRGLVFDVVPRGAPTADFESQVTVAQLTILRGGEVERLIDGTWTCGP